MVDKSSISSQFIQLYPATPVQAGYNGVEYCLIKGDSSKKLVVFIPGQLDIPDFNYNFVADRWKSTGNPSLLLVQSLPVMEAQHGLSFEAIAERYKASVDTLIAETKFTHMDAVYFFSNAGNLFSNPHWDTQYYYISGPIFRTPWTIALNTAVRLILESDSYNYEAKSQLCHEVTSLFLSTYDYKYNKIKQRRPVDYQFMVDLESLITADNFEFPFHYSVEHSSTDLILASTVSIDIGPVIQQSKKGHLYFQE